MWAHESKTAFAMLELFKKGDTYSFVRLKSGFIEKYQVLDSAMEIEQTPFIGPDGWIVIRVNKLSRDPIGESMKDPLANEKADDILRKCGM